LIEEAQVADFIEENCSAIGEFKLALLRCVRTREGSALVPEEFALQQGIRYCGAVDANDWLASSRTVLVNQLSNNLLSSPRFAGDKDVAVGLGDLLKL